MARKKLDNVQENVEEKPLTEPAKSVKRFEVSLDYWIPTMEIEAVSEGDAIDAYKKMMNIISTDKSFVVKPL